MGLIADVHLQTRFGDESISAPNYGFECGLIPRKEL